MEKVDGEKIKANIFYTVKNDEFVETKKNKKEGEYVK